MCVTELFIAYVYRFIDENKSSIKMLWKGIKSIVSIRSNNLDTIPRLTGSDGSKITDSDQMANGFNHFFTNVSSDITKRIPRTPKSPLAFLSKPNLESFLVSLCALNKVCTAIQSLKNGKSSDPNSIPIKLLKVLLNPISL